MPEAPRTRQQEILSILLSLVLGFLIWLYVDSRRTVTMDVDAHVWLTIPEGWEWQDLPPEKISIRIQGSRTRMEALDLSQVAWQRDIVVQHDAAALAVQEAIRPSDFFLPEGVTVVDIKRKELQGRIVRLVPNWVRVQPNIDGKPMDGYKMAQARVTPKFVQVMVPPDFDVSQVEMVTTPLIKLDGTETETLYRQVTVQPLTVGRRVLTSNEKLNVTLMIVPVQKEQEFSNVKLRVLYGPLLGLRISEITPAAVSVVLRGPQKEIEAMKDQLVAYVDIADMAGKPRGEHVFACKVQVVPGVQVVSITPPEVKLVID